MYDCDMVGDLTMEYSISAYLSTSARTAGRKGIMLLFCCFLKKKSNFIGSSYQSKELLPLRVFKRGFTSDIALTTRGQI